VLLSAALATMAAGLTLVALAAVLAGSRAAWGVVLGVLVGTLVLFAGSAVVDLVAGIAPSASLLVALLTYALQLLAMGVFFVAVQRSAGLRDLVDRTWVGAGVLAVAMVWTVAQIALVSRRRIPAFQDRAVDRR
jgi:ATP synthase protein I